MKANVVAAGCVLTLLVGSACSGGNHESGFSPGDGTDGGGPPGTLSPDGSPGTGPGRDGSTPGLFGDASSDTGGGGSCVVTDPNTDMDKDGWTPMQGDCNDCDPNVNPGAIDVLQNPDGGAPVWGDEDCDGNPGDSGKTCDMGLALTDVAASDGAKALDLCAQATDTDRKYGVISANYVRADGTAMPAPGAQVGIQSAFGTNVHVQGGQNMLALSSGYARSVGQPGACNSLSCQINAVATAPTGFPQDDPACPPTKLIADDVALEIKVRVPTNAKGYSFNFKFYSFEFPEYVCDPKGYNDQFIVLVTPPPMGAYVPSGSTGGNISFDSNSHPVSVNLGFFDVCDGVSSRFASSCKSAGGACPTLPSPYCPLGTGELAMTGFDVWESKGPAGATRWLETQAPAQPGSVITMRFAIWDAGNGQYDSTVLVDNFKWSATGGMGVNTQPVPQPQ